MSKIAQPSITLGGVRTNIWLRPKCIIILATGNHSLKFSSSLLNLLIVNKVKKMFFNELHLYH